jgi:hypothetical protein
MGLILGVLAVVAGVVGIRYCAIAIAAGITAIGAFFTSRK